jgi:modulator of FtsH protease HflC
VRGSGDAKAIAIYAQAYDRDPKFFAFYRSLQAYRHALVGKTTSLVLSPKSSFFQFFENPGGSPGGLSTPDAAAKAAPK